MGKGLGCIPSRSHANPTLTTRFDSTALKVQDNANKYNNDDEFEALIVRAQKAKIGINLTYGPQWNYEQQLLAQK